MKRHELQHFVDIEMDVTLANTDYHLLGDGIASLTEEFNAEEETEQWINQENGTTDIKSYTPSISVEMQDIDQYDTDQYDTDLVDWFNNLIDTLPTGSKAISSYVRVRVKGAGPSYPAVQRKCAISVGSTGGDAGSNVTNSITIGGRGDGIQGTFNAETKKFTAGGASTVSADDTMQSAKSASKSNLS